MLNDAKLFETGGIQGAGTISPLDSACAALRQLFINSIHAWRTVCEFVQFKANCFRFKTRLVLTVLRFVGFIEWHAHHLPALYEND
jgi:hypothetical protein